MAFCPRLPEPHPRIARLDDGSAAEVDSFFLSTSCRRHYIGTWEIRDGRFYLVRLEGRYRLLGDEPLLAAWFTGVLRLPRGKRLEYIHMGFGSVYEGELHIKIEKGLVVRPNGIGPATEDVL
jgi:hypothetical protein